MGKKENKGKKETNEKDATRKTREKTKKGKK